MDAWLIANILRLRRTLRHRERWTREHLLGHQQHELATLRAFAMERSPFYRRLHRGLEAAPLAELPVLAKATMMDNFDEILTVPTCTWPTCRPTSNTWTATSGSPAGTGSPRHLAAPGERASSPATRTSGP